ncbi:MAG: FAD:protein FMN transferase [Gammaproteobacteria bacterium]|jgi:thiamine biosynthesis lipoprotein|nr:FAD:protein FMN transferase [Gammaproteobacteria bacterium]
MPGRTPRSRPSGRSSKSTSAIRARAEAAIAAVDRELQNVHRRWHAWEPGPLETVNRAFAGGRRIELPPGMLEPILRAKRLESASEGLFNPAIGRLLALWGFHASQLPSGPPPSQDAIADLLAQSPSMTDIQIENGTIGSRNPAVQMDFGAFIKGVAVERALAILEAHGLEHAIVNAGGDVGVIGSAGGAPWRVGIRHPDGAGGRILAELEAGDGEFVFTSGNYLRYREHEGIRHGHIIDPRSGYPADRVVSVTVIAEHGGTADAGATALAVAGEAEWPRIAARLGIDKVLRVDGQGRVSMTTAMRERVRLMAPQAAVSERSLPPD